MDSKKEITAIVLLAGGGTRIASVTDRPKCLLEVAGKTILEHHLDQWSLVGLRKVRVVLGYEAHQIEKVLLRYEDRLEIEKFYNPDYKSLGNTYSLAMALNGLKTSSLIFDGDLVYHKDILQTFLDEKSPDQFLVGEASLDDIECAKVLIDENHWVRMTVDKRAVSTEELSRYSFAGEAIGIIKLSKENTLALSKAAEQFLEVPENRPKNWEHLMNEFLKAHQVGVAQTKNDQWIEIDTPEDYNRAQKMFM